MRAKLRGFWLILLVPLALGLVRLRFDVEVLNLLPDDDPVVHGLKLYQEHFSNARELVLTITARRAADAELTARIIAEQLRTATNLVSSATWQPPWLEGPAESAELIAYLWANAPPRVFSQITNRFSGEALNRQFLDARETLATSLSPNEFAFRGYDPLSLMQLPDAIQSSESSLASGQDFFSSGDGLFRVVFVEATTELASYRECLHWLDAIQNQVTSVLETNDLEEHVEVGFTGRPAFVAEIAGGMERDMLLSVGGTMLIIAVLFWWAHRRLRPLLWLLLMLALVLGGTMALGGLLIGTLNVVSMGFAAILLGLAVDYGLVLYQESRSNPGSTPRELRQSIGPGIGWAALTTASAFLMLNLSGLPGLGQLGTLVAIGVPLAALVMLFAYLTPLLSTTSSLSNSPPTTHPEGKAKPRLSSLPLVISGILALTSVMLIVNRPPAFDHSGNALRPRNSSAYAALDEIKERLDRTEEPLWLLISGDSESEVSRILDNARVDLNLARSNGLIADYTLPVSLWPDPASQQANRETIQWLLAQRDRVHEAASRAGFTTNALALTDDLLRVWERVARSKDAFWPTNRSSRWVMGKFTARTARGDLCAGLVYPVSDDPKRTRQFLDSWSGELQRQGAILTSWQLLGDSVFDTVMDDLPRVLIPMSALVLLTLWLAYRRMREVFLSLATLAFGGLLLCGLMALAGWRWNLMNLMAMPLLLGAGVDYSIHMQLALRRHSGNLREARQNVGRALLLCGGTTTTAFGTLALSNNAGLSSLGQVCAAGICAATVTAVFLLPSWWKALSMSSTGSDSSS